MKGEQNDGDEYGDDGDEYGEDGDEYAEELAPHSYPSVSFYN